MRDVTCAQPARWPHGTTRTYARSLWGVPFQFRKDYGTSKYVPVDLRRKRTRAIRRALTVKEVRARCPARCLAGAASPGVPLPGNVACCVRVLTRTGVAAPFHWLQKSIKSKRQTVRESNFPKRRFAVAAQA